ncbi:helix-turn-helix domain-containing protein [Streptomyces nodosus]|uniref:helix-turn-helix domain-containing protein n=1 Tax=Streptomyces nodosus TaxID=40318 RepID=UPI0034521D02
MSSPHPAAVRHHALKLMAQGRSVKDVAQDLGLPEQTVYRWHRTSISQSRLRQAHARIEKLEGEITVCRQVINLMREVVPPKGDTK